MAACRVENYFNEWKSCDYCTDPKSLYICINQISAAPLRRGRELTNRFAVSCILSLLQSLTPQ
jgi:hypothetical protein